jgi:hypothetical protein
MNGVTRTKRQNVSEPKEFYAETKKSRSVSRCPCPPLKVIIYIFKKYSTNLHVKLYSHYNIVCSYEKY